MVFVVGGDGRGTFKYSIENSIGVGSTHVLLTTASGIYSPAVEAFSAAAPAHVYAIGTRPRLILKLSRETSASRHVVLTWSSLRPGDDEVQSTIELLPGIDLTVLDDGTRVQVMAHGDVVEDVSAATFLSQQLMGDAQITDTDRDEIHRRFLDLDLVYVGQAFGEDGERTAVSRLGAHSTFQKVLARLNDGPGHLQAWVMLLGFNEQTNAMLFGPWSGTVSFEDSLEPALKRQSAALSYDEATNIAEAAMIRYFQPEYNEKFKYTFPDATHTSYQLPYELDVNCVAFGLETLSTGCRLKSPSRLPQWGHCAYFPLRPAKHRRAYLDLFVDQPDIIVPKG
jgi:hypothetical protein